MGGPRKSWDISRLKNRETQKLFENVKNKKLEEKTPTNNKEDEIEQEWNDMKSNLADTANQVLQ